MTRSKSRPVNRTVVVSLLVVVGGAGLILAEYWYLQKRHESTVSIRADQTVAERVEAARSALAKGDSDGAIDLLEQALEIEGAHSYGEARTLLARARQGQARALLDGALADVVARHAPAARRKARAYLAHPRAADPDQARRLLAELDLAESSAEATARLAKMSDAELTAFAASGVLRDGPDLSIPGTRAIFEHTLRGQLPREQHKRGARLLALAQQEARLRRTGHFQGVQAFVAGTQAKLDKEKQRRVREQKALGVLLQELGVRDAGEEKELKARLAPAGPPEGYAERVAKKRAEVKSAFRQAADSTPADAAVFDRLVDAELDGLLARLGRW
jgi:hypothetical protein